MKRTELGQYIVADPNICHGSLTFKGTRLLVSDVLEMVAEGMDWEAVIIYGAVLVQGVGQGLEPLLQLLPVSPGVGLERLREDGRWPAAITVA